MEETLQPINSSSNPNPKKEISDSSVEKSIATLPNEVIIEILTWLPAKTLARFLCVSKSWRALITTPKFIKAHLRNSSGRDDYAHHRVLFRCMTSSGGEAKGYNPNTRYFSLAPVFFGDGKTTIRSTLVEDPVMNSRGSEIIGSANGLLCVGIKRKLFFWNPTIRKFKKLPEFYPHSKPSKKRHVVFEYDEVDGDYRVYFFASYYGSENVLIDVYSRNTNTWRRIQRFCIANWPAVGFLVARGILYWGDPVTYEGVTGLGMVWADLKSETIGIVALPDYAKDVSRLDFGILEGCLAFCCYHPTSHVDLWIMKEDGVKKSWSKVLLVSKFKDSGSKKSCLPIFMSKDGKILFRYWKSLALSDPKAKLVSYPHVSFMGVPWQVELLVESLVLINENDAKGQISDSSFQKSLETLPSELIVEILTWLPAKTLVQFRCVSKSWRDVISSPKFIKSQLKKSSKRDDYARHTVLYRCAKTFGDTRLCSYDTWCFPLASVFFGDVDTTIESSLVEDPFINTRKAEIVAAANGIVCLMVKKDFYFWNPTIRKFKKLPRFHDLPKEAGQIQALFGYYEDEDDHQLCLLAFREKWIAVYSGNTNTWRQIRGFIGRLGEGYFLVRGKVYWGKGTSGKAKIRWFDLKTETYGVLQQPNYGKGTFDMVFGVFLDGLSVFCYHRTSHIDMWIMKENMGKQSWTKVLLVPKLKDPNREVSCQPVFMSKDGRILFDFWKFMALSDPKTKSVSYPRINPMGEPWLTEVVVESLFLVNDHDAKGPMKDPDDDGVVMVQRRLE
ncbi:OLC1v1019465C1 [Oldenlandia corymbosa var. corymbosa]|uniref:OLC1v1019465C1 n=1 Tax=Oldenlandia corymbosa var. corymbosa TaxID=529605 RepID=A0AAV1EE55_OLDCO|nr:OLC1v1019465C1 [Oldenlandia corymbosa var. corymbosa]